MEFIQFVIFSSMEYLAMFALMFALFRFEYKFYHSSVLFISALLSFVSYSVRIGFDQAAIDPIVTVLLIFAFLHFIFQIQVFYASLMTVTGYVAYGIAQYVCFFLMNFAGLITMDGAKPNTFQGHLLQVVTSIAVCLITYWIKRRNFGFAYVPHGQRAFVRYQGLNKLFLISIIASTVLAWVSLYFGNEENTLLYFLFTLPLIAVFAVLIYLSIRKEYSND